MDERGVEHYRQPWESEDHWKLRKEFILKYKDQFPEYTLIALSQVRSDTELHGKSFPVPVILPESQEVEIQESQEGGPQPSEGKKQSDSQLFVEEEQKDTEDQDEAEILCEEGEEEQEDPEMFVEILDEDHDDPEMLDESNRNDSETYRKSIQQDRLQLETVRNRSQGASRNRHSGCQQSSADGDIQFDSLTESSNDENSSQANLPHSDLSAENSGELPESLKENLVDAFQFVKKLHAEKLNASQILDKLAKQFNVNVECMSEELRKAKCVHVCSVMIDGVSISMGKAPTKKGARRQAVNLAVARLMNINWLLVKANFSFSKLSEIVCATRQNSSQSAAIDLGGMVVESSAFQAVAVPEKSVNEAGWNSSQDIGQTSGNNEFESSSGQNEFQYDFYGNQNQNYALQSSYARSEESSSSEKVIQGMLPRSFKDNFVDVFQYIKKLHDEKLNGLQILEKVSKQFTAKVEFNCAVFTHAKSVHHCTVEIDGVLISRGKGLTKKNARRDAGKLAVDRLMQLLTRAKLSFSYRSKLLSATDMNSLDMLGNLNRSETMLRSAGSSNVMYENYPFENKFDGNKTRHSSSDSTMRSSKSLQSLNSYALDTLPTPLKAKFKQISQFVRKSLAQKVNPVSILNNMSQKFKVTVKFRVKEHHFLSHECFLYIDTKVFAQAEALSEREARSNAAKLAVDRLVEISDKVRNVNSGKEDASVNAFVASSDHNVTERKNGWFATNSGTGISNFGRDVSVSYPSKSSVTQDPIVDAYKNSSWLLNVIKYNCAVNPETTLRAARSSGLACVAPSGSMRQNVNSVNIFDEMSQNANRRYDNENLSRFMVDYPRQNVSVRSSYPAQSAEPGYMRSNLISTAERRSDIPCMADRCDLPNRAEKYDLSPWEERFNLPDRTKRFDLPNRTERFDQPSNRTERFDLPDNRFDQTSRTERFDLPDNRFDQTSRTERFDVPDRRERFDVPSNKMEMFNIPNRTEGFNLPNRAERFDLPRKAERFDLPHKAEEYDLSARPERRHLPTQINSRQSWVQDDSPKVWLHEL